MGQAHRSHPEEEMDEEEMDEAEAEVVARATVGKEDGGCRGMGDMDTECPCIGLQQIGVRRIPISKEGM